MDGAIVLKRLWGMIFKALIIKAEFCAQSHACSQF